MFVDEFDKITETKLKKMAEDGTTILVTGGSGYLGSVLVEMLINRGFKVTVIDNLSYGQNTLFNLFYTQKLEFIYGDVTNDKLIATLLSQRKYDFIFPLAAIVGFPISEQKPEITWMINHHAIVNLLKYRKKEEKIIFPNTNSGYGTTTGETFCTEESPLNPISTYGKSKAEAEKVVMAEGNSISFRLATLFGFSPRMRTDLLVNDFVLKALTDKSIVLFERTFKRNFLHVRDAARGFLWAMVNWEKMKNNIYNLGHPDYNISKEELALLIKKKIPNLNIFYAEIGQDPDKRNYIVSTEKIQKTGFVYKYTLDEGIDELIKGYQAFRDYRFKNY
ncbi:MAG: NAD(P)-dependent oxidoreductase [Candidatus Bilamarchaeaceae archaeon]